MNANEVIQSYVRDVVGYLPRARRGDVALELQALLHEELAERARAAGGAPDRSLAMALLRDFGRPAEAAQRYHARPPLVEAADTPHFLIWAVGGAVVLAVHAQVSFETVPVATLWLQWLGTLVLAFSAVAAWRRHRPGAFGWKPRHGPAWMPRGLSALGLVGLLVFPLSMYWAPQGFARLLMPASVPVEGLALSEGFASSWQRAVTLALLLALAAQQAISLLLGARPRWQRRLEVAIDLALGLMLVAHASPMQPLGGGQAYAVFRSAHANAVAAPIFMALAGMMVLFGLYYGYRAWNETGPRPRLAAALE